MNDIGLKAMLKPFASQRLSAWPVEKAIGNVKNDTPDLIKRAAVQGPRSKSRAELHFRGNRMDKLLESMWDELNNRHFEGQLEKLTAIGWGELSGPKGIGAHGKFIPRSKCIIIDEMFKFDPEAMKRKDPQEWGKFDIAQRLLLHEMVHQSLHQKKKPNPGGHGASFLEEAQRIAQSLGEKPPTADNVDRWPGTSLFDIPVDDSTEDKQE